MDALPPGVLFTARFHGECESCGAHISPGDDISRNPEGRGYFCVFCTDDE